MIRRPRTTPASALPPKNHHADRLADMICRVRAEFLEMPGLKLTAAQAARLWASDFALCQTVLETLVETRFLVRTRDEGFQKA